MKIAISQMVLERAQFEHRADYLSFEPGTTLPPSDVRLGVQTLRPKGDAVNVMVRLTAESAKDALYVFSASYVALLSVDTEGEAPADLERRIMITGSSMLLPFLREVVANLTAKGRFGPTWLAPVNFHDIVPQEAAAATATP